MMMMMMKVIYCRQAYDVIRSLFQEICGNLIDAGNAIWFGLAMYIASAIFMFFLALQLTHAVRTADNRIRPRRMAIVDLDRPKKKESVESVEMTTEQGDWKRRRTSYRVPGKTHGHWLQNPDERKRRRSVVS